MQSKLFSIDTALITTRTVVRRFREGEGTQLLNLIKDNQTLLIDHFPKLVQQLKDRTSAEVFVREKLISWLKQEEFSFGVWDNDSAKMIGLILIHEINWYMPDGRISYFIDRGFANRGIMTEVLWTVVRYAFQQLKMEKLYVKMAADNHPSQRLARKCGFHREGDLRSAFRKSTGDVVDLILMGLNSSDFKEKQ